MTWRSPRRSARRSSVPVIASGGAGELEHLAEALARRRRRRAVRVDLPLRALHDRRGQGAPGRGRHPRARGLRPLTWASDDAGERAARARSRGQLPGGRELLELAGRREDVALVGGAVRDLLLGRAPRELDVVVAGDAGAAARASSRRSARRRRALDAVHERFGTAVVEWEAGRVDIAQRRGETYPRRAPCPRSDPAASRRTCAPRLHRQRDRARARRAARAASSTPPSSARGPRARAPARAARAQLQDDPTRLLRLARYEARLVRARAAHRRARRAGGR